MKPLPNVSGAPVRAWRIRYNEMTASRDLNQLVAAGGALMCPAVLGVVTPALRTGRKGEFWFGAEERCGYRATIEEAKAEVERLTDETFKSFALKTAGT